jgi:hypothetical protein
MRYLEIEFVDERIKEKIEAGSKGTYFVVRELEECEKLIPEVEKEVDEYKFALKRFYKNSYRSASEAVLDVLRSTAKDLYKDVAMSIAFSMAFEATFERALEAAKNAAIEPALASTLSSDVGPRFEAAFEAALNAAKCAAFEAAWVVVEDYIKCDVNPFEPIGKIYRMGLDPRGFRKVDGIEKFIVDFPTKLNERACWAEGDSRISYKHTWTEDCREIKPIRPLRIIE